MNSTSKHYVAHGKLFASPEIPQLMTADRPDKMKHFFCECLIECGQSPDDLTPGLGLAVGRFIQQIDKHWDEIAPGEGLRFYRTTEDALLLECFEALKAVCSVDKLAPSTHSALLAILKDAYERELEHVSMALPLSRIFDFIQRQLGTEVVANPDYIRYPIEEPLLDPLDPMAWHLLMDISRHHSTLATPKYLDEDFPGAAHRREDLYQAAWPLFRLAEFDLYGSHDAVELFMGWAGRLLKEGVSYNTMSSRVQ